MLIKTIIIGITIVGAATAVLTVATLAVRSGAADGHGFALGTLLGVGYVVAPGMVGLIATAGLAARRRDH